MKFGKFLKRRQIFEWADYYVNYKGLKKLIGAFEHSESDSNDKFFRARLLQETDRVNSFFLEKLQVYHQRFEKSIQDDKATAEETHALLRDCLKLKDFGYLNSEGLRKLCKKFDKKCNFDLMSDFLPDLQQTKLRDCQSLHNMIEDLCTRLGQFKIPFGITQVEDSGLHKKTLFDARSKLGDTLEKARQQNKQVIVPMAVEPRTYLALERTFLKWIRESGLLIIAGSCLLKFNHERISGLFCLVLALVLSFRSYFIFNDRLDIILNRSEGEWYDRRGPQLVIGGITLPVCVFVIYVLYFDDVGKFKI